MEIKSNKLIVVLGMHRSGTSAITRGLQVMGVGLGDRMMPPVEGNNPKGFWEDIDLNALNIEMLSAIDSDWCHVAAIDPIDVAILRKEGYFLHAAELLQQKVSSTPIFGFKDPRVAKLLPFWKEVFSHCQFDVSYVMAIRHPLSVVKSLAKRDGIEAEQCYLLWLGHVITSLTGSAGDKRVLVDYDRLMQTPDHELNRMAKHLDLEIDPTELQSYKTEFLDQGLRHTVYDLNYLLLDDTCPPIVCEVYAALLDVASEKTKLDDLELQNKVMSWSDEFERLRSPLLLVDKLFAQKLVATQAVAERDGQITNLHQAVDERDVITSEQSQQISALNQTIDSLLIERDAYKQAMVERDVITSEQSQQFSALNQTIDSLLIERDAYKQAMVERDVIISEQSQQISALNQNIQDRDLANATMKNELQTILSSRSWKLTKVYRYAGRIIRGDWAAIRNQSEYSTMKDTLSDDVDLQIPLITTDSQDSQKKRILLVSYFCPTRAHAGGLRILDIYTLIKTTYPDVTIDLYTYKRPEIDWSYSDIESLFDNVYFSPTEDLLPSGISANVSRHYDVIDLQFHQSAYHLEKWRFLGRKIIFTPMESLVRSLVIDLRANLTCKSIFSLRKIVSGLKCAAEEIVFASKADEVICVSRADASLLRSVCRTKNINFLETALSTLEFADAINNADKELNPELKENSIVYVAYFGSETNIIALKWYLEQIHPLIELAVPDYKLQIVGRGDLSTFNNYRSNSVEFIGEVASLTPAINAAKIGIAPALNGAGLRGKINQYAIFGVPSVVSSISANGLVYKDSVDIFITDEPAIFAERCIRLLKDNELNKKMGLLAREKAFANYSWESKLDAVRKIYCLE